eukprot:gene11499-34218_t
MAAEGSVSTPRAERMFEQLARPVYANSTTGGSPLRNPSWINGYTPEGYTRVHDDQAEAGGRRGKVARWEAEFSGGKHGAGGAGRGGLGSQGGEAKNGRAIFVGGTIPIEIVKLRGNLDYSMTGGYCIDGEACRKAGRELLMLEMMNQLQRSNAQLPVEASRGKGESAHSPEAAAPHRGQQPGVYARLAKCNEDLDTANIQGSCWKATLQAVCAVPTSYSDADPLQHPSSDFGSPGSTDSYQYTDTITSNVNGSPTPTSTMTGTASANTAHLAGLSDRPPLAEAPHDLQATTLGPGVSGIRPQLLASAPDCDVITGGVALPCTVPRQVSVSVSSDVGYYEDIRAPPLNPGVQTQGDTNTVSAASSGQGHSDSATQVSNTATAFDVTEGVSRALLPTTFTRPQPSRVSGAKGGPEPKLVGTSLQTLSTNETSRGGQFSNKGNTNPPTGSKTGGITPTGVALNPAGPSQSLAAALSASTHGSVSTHGPGGPRPQQGGAQPKASAVLQAALEKQRAAAAVLARAHADLMAAHRPFPPPPAHAHGPFPGLLATHASRGYDFPGGAFRSTSQQTPALFSLLRSSTSSSDPLLHPSHNPSLPHNPHSLPHNPPHTHTPHSLPTTLLDQLSMAASRSLPSAGSSQPASRSSRPGALLSSVMDQLDPRVLQVHMMMAARQTVMAAVLKAEERPGQDRAERYRAGHSQSPTAAAAVHKAEERAGQDRAVQDRAVQEQAERVVLIHSGPKQPRKRALSTAAVKACSHWRYAGWLTAVAAATTSKALGSARTARSVSRHAVGLTAVAVAANATAQLCEVLPALKRRRKETPTRAD